MKYSLWDERRRQLGLRKDLNSTPGATGAWPDISPSPTHTNVVPTDTRPQPLGQTCLSSQPPLTTLLQLLPANDSGPRQGCGVKILHHPGAALLDRSTVPTCLSTPLSFHFSLYPKALHHGTCQGRPPQTVIRLSPRYGPGEPRCSFFTLFKTWLHFHLPRFNLDRPGHPPEPQPPPSHPPLHSKEGSLILF